MEEKDKQNIETLKRLTNALTCINTKVYELKCVPEIQKKPQIQKELDEIRSAAEVLYEVATEQLSLAAIGVDFPPFL